MIIQSRAWNPSKLRLCCQVVQCCIANHIEIVFGKLLSCAPQLPTPPHPGTIPVPRVPPVGRGGGSCAAVCLVSLLVAWTAIKGVVGPNLQSFGTFLLIFGAEPGCLKKTSLWSPLLQPHGQVKPCCALSKGKVNKNEE